MKPNICMLTKNIYEVLLYKIAYSFLRSYLVNFIKTKIIKTNEMLTQQILKMQTLTYYGFF